MIACPNINDPDWKALKKAQPKRAYYLWNKYEGNVPKEFYTIPQVVTKPGIQELFNSNPELTSIGTPQQYSQYLDTIFPNSKVKDIVYHGSDTTFDGFLEDNLNYFGTKEIAKGYGKNLYPVLIEINKPYYEDGGNLSNQSYEDLYDKLDESGSDGFISNGKNLFVPKTEEQIHILGSKQDIEGFKEFVGNVEDVATDIGLDMSSDEAKAFNSLVNDGTISIKCE